MRMWRNWQTRMIQVHVPAMAWRFKSSHPHQILKELRPFFEGVARSSPDTVAVSLENVEWSGLLFVEPTQKQGSWARPAAPKAAAPTRTH